MHTNVHCHTMYVQRVINVCVDSSLSGGGVEVKGQKSRRLKRSRSGSSAAKMSRHASFTGVCNVCLYYSTLYC